MGTLSPLVTSRIHALRAAKIAARDDPNRCDLCLRIAVESRTCVPGECPLAYLPAHLAWLVPLLNGVHRAIHLMRRALAKQLFK
jgi:hypothetical protein